MANNANRHTEHEGHIVAEIRGVTYTEGEVETFNTGRNAIYPNSTGPERFAFKRLHKLSTSSPHKWDAATQLVFCADHDIVPITGAPKRRGTKKASIKRTPQVTPQAAPHIEPQAAPQVSPQTTTEPKAETPELVKQNQRFPMDKAATLRENALPAYSGDTADSITGTFELRPLIIWAQAYYAYQAEGLTAHESLAMGFNVALVWKTLPEERQFLRELFAAEFGFECEPKTSWFTKQRTKYSRALTPKGQLPAIVHPQFPVIVPLIKAGITTWIHGPASAGKSFALKQAARLLQRPLMRVQGSNESEIGDLLGNPTLLNDAGTSITGFQHGPVPQAMRAGAILNMDEITLYSNSVQSELHAILELGVTEPLVIKANGGETVHRVDGFVVCFSNNDMGFGERPEYVGSAPASAAFRDRCAFIEFGSMPTATIVDALTRQIETEFLANLGWSV